MELNLKKKLAQDLETLKHLDLEIIPARRYYLHIILGWFFLFGLFFSIQTVACFFAIKIKAWDYAPHTERWEKHNLERMNREELILRNLPSLFDLEKEFPDASQKELQLILKGKEHQWHENYLKRKKIREDNYNKACDHEQTILLTKMIFGVFFSSILMSLFGLIFIKNFTIFKLQISPKLQTGNYLIKKLNWALVGFFMLFSGLAFLFIPLFEQDVVFFSTIPCLIIAIIGTATALNLELSRIGVSVLSKALSDYFYKAKESV